MNSFFCCRGRWIVGVLLLVGLTTGCVGSRSAEDVPPDQQFGHRYDDDGPQGRMTIAITPADGSIDYFYYPATFDSVHIRPAPFDPASPAEMQQVDVEVLVKGAFPDACMELHAIEQERAGNIINATLEMRRARGAICASVHRPYRFYVMLTGQYGIGHYTLKLNNTVIPFEVMPPPEQTQ